MKNRAIGGRKMQDQWYLEPRAVTARRHASICVCSDSTCRETGPDCRSRDDLLCAACMPLGVAQGAAVDLLMPAEPLSRPGRVLGGSVYQRWYGTNISSSSTACDGCFHPCSSVRSSYSSCRISSEQSCSVFGGVVPLFCACEVAFDCSENRN